MINATIIQAIVRHLLTGVAGGFAVKYGIDGGAVDAAGPAGIHRAGNRRAAAP